MKATWRVFAYFLLHCAFPPTRVNMITTITIIIHYRQNNRGNSSRTLTIVFERIRDFYDNRWLCAHTESSVGTS